jgi:hypothetical protein
MDPFHSSAHFPYCSEKKNPWPLKSNSSGTQMLSTHPQDPPFIIPFYHPRHNSDGHPVPDLHILEQARTKRQFSLIQTSDITWPDNNGTSITRVFGLPFPPIIFEPLIQAPVHTACLLAPVAEDTKSAPATEDTKPAPVPKPSICACTKGMFCAICSYEISFMEEVQKLSKRARTVHTHPVQQHP